MKHIKNKQISIQRDPIIDSIFCENAIFLDIETTGFSSASSCIYLIGCMHRSGQSLIIEQFLAENKDDEEKILIEFMTLLKKYDTIITFNGIGFDIPFIKAKCDFYSIEEALNIYTSIDIFKHVNSIKFLLKLPNYKQKTIEHFLDVSRNDMFTGGELIQIFEDYCNTHSSDAEQLLLLHNYEDVLGMQELLPILSYGKILAGNFNISDVTISPYTSYEDKTGQEMIITLHNDYDIPKRVSYQYEEFYLTMHHDISRIRIPVFEGELRYFHANYKDYYYLPKEDLAIHKSVATFVDKQYREKAKASNCYTRKTGVFLPQYEAIVTPVFLKEHKDICSYFELTEDFSSSDATIRRYVDHIFKLFIKSKGKDRR